MILTGNEVNNPNCFFKSIGSPPKVLPFMGKGIISSFFEQKKSKGGEGYDL